MDSFRNHWFYTHFPRFSLNLPIHFSPFNQPLDNEINEILYAGKLQEPDPIIEIKTWEKWWHENRDKPFHIQYLATKEEAEGG